MDRTQTAIDQVKQIFPDLGEGYIEAALQCYSMNVEETVTNLLDPKSLHPRLRAVDKKLPRAKPKSTSVAQRAKKDQDEAKMVQKQYLREMQEREERDAFIAERLSRNLNIKDQGGMKSTDNDLGLDQLETYDDKDPYDDDYDDQFDDMGDQHIGVGTAGTSFLADNDDYESVKRYNAMMKEDEQEEEFWEESRNLNRQRQTKEKSSKDEDDDDADDGEENESNGKKWGPNKAKGGRILGPDGKPLPRSNNNRSRQKGANSEKGNPPASRGKSPKDNPNESSGGNKNAKAGQRGQKQGGQQKGTGDGSELSGIEKRRKNDNKAKIGNHNRKDRALKKGSRGM